MAVLGQHLRRPDGASSGLSGLADLLERAPAPVVTLFVVGNYAETLGSELVGAGRARTRGRQPRPRPRPPARATRPTCWTGCAGARHAGGPRPGRPVRGFRSPRFDVPAGMGLARYRELLAEAGFEYVSDTASLGPASPVRELPVLARFGYPFGGGSYQRLLPAAVARRRWDRPPGRSSSTTIRTISGPRCPPPLRSGRCRWPSSYWDGGGSAHCSLRCSTGTAVRRVVDARA